MTLRELDAVVAEKVMGHDTFSLGSGEMAESRQCADEDSGGCETRDLARYSTDIAAAWEVVEKLRGEGGFELFAPGTVTDTDAGLFSTQWEATLRHWYAEADTAPLAICLAALKAVGVDVPEVVRQ